MKWKVRFKYNELNNVHEKQATDMTSASSNQWPDYKQWPGLQETDALLCACRIPTCTRCGVPNDVFETAVAASMGPRCVTVPVLGTIDCFNDVWADTESGSDGEMKIDIPLLCDNESRDVDMIHDDIDCTSCSDDVFACIEDEINVADHIFTCIEDEYKVSDGFDGDRKVPSNSFRSIPLHTVQFLHELLSFVQINGQKKFKFIQPPTCLPGGTGNNKCIDVQNGDCIKSVCRAHLLRAFNSCCPLFAIGAYGQTPESVHPFNILGAKYTKHGIVLFLYSFISRTVTTSRIVNDGAHILREARATKVQQFQLSTPRKLLRTRKDDTSPRSRLSIRDYLRVYQSFAHLRRNEALRLPSIIFSFRASQDVTKVQEFINGRGDDGWFIQLFGKKSSVEIGNYLPDATGHRVTCENKDLNCKERLPNGSSCACIDIKESIHMSDFAAVDRVNAMAWLACTTPSSIPDSVFEYPLAYKHVAHFPKSEHEIVQK